MSSIYTRYMNLEYMHELDKLLSLLYNLNSKILLGCVAQKEQIIFLSPDSVLNFTISLSVSSSSVDSPSW